MAKMEYPAWLVKGLWGIATMLHDFAASGGEFTEEQLQELEYRGKQIVVIAQQQRARTAAAAARVADRSRGVVG
jgi:hypothetical protein